jgi:hypothetical protein
MQCGSGSAKATEGLALGAGQAVISSNQCEAWGPVLCRDVNVTGYCAELPCNEAVSIIMVEIHFFSRSEVLKAKLLT